MMIVIEVHWLNIVAVTVIFCCDPITPSRVDEAFEREATAARSVGLAYALIDYERLVAGDADDAVRRVAASADGVAVYRGWMLTVVQYAALFAALRQRGVQLVNDPAQYQYAHWFPESYPALAAVTPQSICIPSDELDWTRLPERLSPFGAQPLVVKDWVKSRKHEWDEACFIPSARDGAAVERVARRFVALQGADLVGGLVFRAFESFAPLGRHAQSGMPVTKELRLFFLDGALLFSAHYWDDQDYGALAAPPAFAALARQLRSRFFTLDVALRADGVWRVVEMGDGQVSGLPENAAAEAFYGALACHFAA